MMETGTTYILVFTLKLSNPLLMPLVLLPQIVNLQLQTLNNSMVQLRAHGNCKQNNLYNTSQT